MYKYTYIYFLFVFKEIRTYYTIYWFPGGLDGKEFACNVGDLDSIPGLGRFPSILAWKIPWTEQCMWLQRVGHD